MDSTSECVEENYEDPGCGGEEATTDFKQVIQRKPKRRLLPMIPHNYLSFLKDADKEFDSSSSSTKDILDQLYKGVLLGGGKKKYWIDKESNSNCLMMFSRALSVIHGDNKRYWEWEWESTVETRFAYIRRDGAQVEVAVLLDVCWLEIKGKFRTIMFSSGTLYEVVIVVKMRVKNHGWNIPVTLDLTFPDGQTNKSARLLKDIETDVWTDVLLGEFTVTPTTVGEITFSLSETKTGQWKRGLIIKGVAIRPKAIP